MSEKKTPTITINEKEYTQEDMNEKQLALLPHMLDLQRKIKSGEFNLVQLNVGLKAFITEFENELE